MAGNALGTILASKWQNRNTDQGKWHSFQQMISDGSYAVYLF